MNIRLLTSIAVLLVVAFAGPVHAESLFADKNLEAIVRKYVFEKRNTDKPLVEDDVKDISSIDFVLELVGDWREV